jgi:hypothetical protein
LISGSARSELLSRFWYVAQRRGISLSPYDAATGTPPHPDAPEQVATRLAMLAAASGFLRPGLPLQELAEASQVHLYRPGDQLLAAGVKAPAARLFPATVRMCGPREVECDRSPQLRLGDVGDRELGCGRPWRRRRLASSA